MARIRTVKPEYWRHPVMARQPDDVRLMAVALLNIADDEGLFFADPALLRGEVWPFDEDSSRTRRVLEQLERIGWISVREHPEIGMVGKVVNFTKHQKVDRPTPSKIKGYFDSSNIRRGLDEDSLLEQGTGNREQGSIKRFTRTDALVFLTSRGVENRVAEEWLSCRKTKRLTNTMTAFEDVEKESIKAGLLLNDAIKKSVSNGWAGFRAEWLNRDGPEKSPSRHGDFSNKDYREGVNADGSF